MSRKKGSSANAERWPAKAARSDLSSRPCDDSRGGALVVVASGKRARLLVPPPSSRAPFSPQLKLYALLAVGGCRKAGIEPAGVGSRTPSAKLHLSRAEGGGYRRLCTLSAVLRSGLLLVAGFPRPAPSVLRPPEAGAGRASPAFWRRSACFSVRALRRRRASSPRSCRAVVLFSVRFLRAAPALSARGRVLPPFGGASAAARPPPGAAPNCAGSWPRSWVRFSAAPASGRCALSSVCACIWARHRRRCAAVVLSPVASAARSAAEAATERRCIWWFLGAVAPSPPFSTCSRHAEFPQKILASDVLIWYNGSRKEEGTWQRPKKWKRLASVAPK